MFIEIIFPFLRIADFLFWGFLLGFVGYYVNHLLQNFVDFLKENYFVLLQAILFIAAIVESVYLVEYVTSVPPRFADVIL